MHSLVETVGQRSCSDKPCSYSFYLIGPLFTGSWAVGLLLMNISLPAHNNSPMMAAANNSSSRLFSFDKSACEENPGFYCWPFPSLLLSFYPRDPRTVATVCCSNTVALVSVCLREAREIKQPFALRNFMHYSEVRRIISPRQLLRGRWGDNC